MKNSSLNVISRSDYNVFREARQIISNEFGDKLSLLDPAIVDRIAMYASLSNCERLHAISSKLGNNASWHKTSGIISKLAAPAMQLQAA